MKSNKLKLFIICGLILCCRYIYLRRLSANELIIKENIKNNLPYLFKSEADRNKVNLEEVVQDTNTIYSVENKLPIELRELKVAIDPGHLAKDEETAALEGRLVKIKGTDLGIPNDISFFEADLTYTTALFLKEMLEEKGVEVFLTRQYGQASNGMDFDTWLKEKFRGQAEDSFKSGDLSEAEYSELLSSHIEMSTYSNRRKLFKFYNRVDLKERARKINAFGPHITICMHYNASDTNEHDGNRYFHPVDENYSMAFIPGAFLTEELEKTDQKLELLRLLSKEDIGDSKLLANFVLEEHKKILGVNQLLPLPLGFWMEESTVQTEYHGVLSRNLTLTRMVKGMVIYVESLIQDDKKEALLLANKDTSVVDTNGDVLPASSRTKQVALAYYRGMMRYFESKNGEFNR